MRVSAPCLLIATSVTEHLNLSRNRCFLRISGRDVFRIIAFGKTEINEHVYLQREKLMFPTNCHFNLSTLALLISATKLPFGNLDTDTGF